MTWDPITRRTILKTALAGTAGLHPLAALGERLTAGDQPRLVAEIQKSAEPLPEVSDPAFGRLFDRFADARVVLVGEATHGTSEFYQARAAVTQHLIQHHGFTVVAVEADWPDGSHVDAFIRSRERPVAPARPFRRFPTWMWRNEEVRLLIDWLKQHNGSVVDPRAQVGYYGLDLYGLGASIDVVSAQIANGHPAVAADVRRQYACLAPYGDEPADYAADSLRPGFRACEDEVATALKIIEERLAPGSDPAAFDMLQNARAVVSGEHYYRTMAQGAVSSWNLRDEHMFRTLIRILDSRGPDSKAIVWAHNSHIGNAAATDMARRGEHNIGQLCRQHFGDKARLIGFGTDRGTVIAASRWGGEPEVKVVRPSLEGSYEALFRQSEKSRFLLDLRSTVHTKLREGLKPERLERAIGVIYLPATERVSHYFGASLPEQFDAYLWFEETRAVTPIRDADPSLPPNHPFST